MTRDWDATTYDRVSGPQVEMARAVLDRLDLRGDETVLDAGCGSGRVTRMLLERCARVIAVDGSESMVEEARAALPADVTVLHQDLQELHLDESVDAAFSNAVFHWVPDHALLFGRIFGVLRPGGRLVAQCGGKGNVERFHAVAREVGAQPPFAQYLEAWEGPWNFADPEDTAMRLEEAGFTHVETWLADRPVVPEFTEDYLRTVCLGNHVDRLPEELRDEYVTAVAERCAQPVELDYVRLNIEATRPA
ncbi:MAG: methyltransferase domain-containing protein [Thermoleophilaceae bacterium]|nr:methyltransferase domain-containing protein [Thermoleophilaceae bacterium]